MEISHVMSRSVELLGPQSTAEDAARVMREKDVGFVPVGANDKLQGVVTDRDIVTRVVATGAPAQETPLSDILSENVLYVFDDQSVEEAAQNMAQNAVQRLMVVDREKNLVGVVSLGDIARGGAAKYAGVALRQIAHAA